MESSSGSFLTSGEAKLAGVEPWAYLRDVLDRLPSHPHSRIGELLPKQWAAARAAAQPVAAAAPA